MYQGFFGFRDLPFEITPDPKFVFLSSQHREALANLQYGLSTAKAITALIGDAGTGKTTLLHAALTSEKCRSVSGVYISSPTLTRAEFVELIALRFGLSGHAAESKTAMLLELEPLLHERRAKGEIVALVVDEAQSLSGELLEEIRLLANLESESEKLLPVVLAGQSELRDRLNEESLHQLKQRVTLRCELRPFAVEETAKYIATRVRVAGGDPSRIFTREAVMLIHQRSGGIPRTINVICDNALITGFGLARQLIDSEIVAGVVRDFDLERAADHRPPTIDLASGRPPRPFQSNDTFSETPADARRGDRKGSVPLFSMFRGR